MAKLYRTENLKKELKPLPSNIFNAIGLGICGLVFFWSWPLWPPTANSFGSGVGLLLTLMGFFSSLFSIRRKPFLSLATILCLGLSVYICILFSPLSDRDFILKSRIESVRGQVNELRGTIRDEELLATIISSPHIGQHYRREVTKTSPTVVSFLIAEYGIDDGANLVFDPSDGFARFIGGDNRIDTSHPEWAANSNLVRYKPTKCKRLGDGWYLVYFT